MANGVVLPVVRLNAFTVMCGKEFITIIITNIIIITIVCLLGGKGSAMNSTTAASAPVDTTLCTARVGIL